MEQQQQSNNDVEMAKMLKEIDEINNKKRELKEKLDKTTAKMAEIERNMREETAEMKNQISGILDEERALLGQIQKIKEQQKKCGNGSITRIEELMQQQQRKRAAVIEGESDICWPKLHGNVKRPYYEKPLGFYYKEDESGNARPILYRFLDEDYVQHPNEIVIDEEEEDEYAEAEIIPIATVQPPEYILGFISIQLWFLDGQVIQFMENANTKVKKITLKPTIDMQKWEGSQFMATHRLLATFSGKIYELNFTHNSTTNSLEQFHANFPYIFDETQRLTIDTYKDARTNFLIDWLTTKQRIDGKHRLLWLLLTIDTNKNSLKKSKRNSRRQPNQMHS